MESSRYNKPDDPDDNEEEDEFFCRRGLVKKIKSPRNQNKSRNETTTFLANLSKVTNPITTEKDIEQRKMSISKWMIELSHRVVTSSIEN